MEVCPVPLLLLVPRVALLQPELERGARHLEALARLLVPEEAGVGAVVPGVPARVTLHCTAQHSTGSGGGLMVNIPITHLAPRDCRSWNQVSSSPCRGNLW